LVGAPAVCYSRDREIPSISANYVPLAVWRCYAAPYQGRPRDKCHQRRQVQDIRMRLCDVRTSSCCDTTRCSEIGAVGGLSLVPPDPREPEPTPPSSPQPTSSGMRGVVHSLQLLTLLQRVFQLPNRARPRHDTRPGLEGQEHRDRQGIGTFALSPSIHSQY
jgi:hypothetical protein